MSIYVFAGESLVSEMHVVTLFGTVLVAASGSGEIKLGWAPALWPIRTDVSGNAGFSRSTASNGLSISSVSGYMTRFCYGDVFASST